MTEEEHRELARTAGAHRMTVSAWVRQVLRDAVRREPAGQPERKIRVVREAARHRYPAPPIERMLEEIERGYLPEGPA